MRNTVKDLLVHVAQHLGLEVGEDDVPGRLPLLVPGVIVPVEHQDGLWIHYSILQFKTMSLNVL